MHTVSTVWAIFGSLLLIPSVVASGQLWRRNTPSHTEESK